MYGVNVIEVKSLCKSYGAIKAVDSISFSVAKGEILGFLGPNGAGKSTTMKMLTCFISPTSGSASINGFDIAQDSIKVRALVGYLPESAPSYGEMTVHEFLQFIGEVRGDSGEKLQKRIDEILEKTHLKEVRYQPIETLSKGFRQRVGFAQALYHNPPVLVLDEPTDGLDPNQKHEVREFIKTMGNEKTIILSTHILEEADMVCSRVIIIDRGKIVADDTPSGLVARNKNPEPIVIVVNTQEEWSSLKEIFEKQTSLQIIHTDILTTKNENQRFEIRLAPVKGAPSLGIVRDILRDKNIFPLQIYKTSGKMDEVFRQLTFKHHS